MSLPGSYTPNVPLGNQQINNTQQPIEINFQDIANLIGVNHVDFNTANLFGRHNFVSYVEQETSPQTTSNQMALWSAPVSGDPNVLELFYRYPNNGNIVQLTPSSGGSSPSYPTGVNGGGYFNFSAQSGIPYGGPVTGFWQYLTGGILFMTCYLNNLNQSGASINTSFITNFPVGTATNGLKVPQFSRVLAIFQSGSYIAQGNIPTYAITPIDNSSAIIYFNGTAPNQTATDVGAITIIGV